MSYGFFFFIILIIIMAIMLYLQILRMFQFVFDFRHVLQISKRWLI